MKKLHQMLAVFAVAGFSMTALANLPVRKEDKCDKCRPTPTEPCCDDEAKNDGINNGCVNLTIPFGRAATEFETDLILFRFQTQTIQSKRENDCIVFGFSES